MLSAARGRAGVLSDPNDLLSDPDDVLLDYGDVLQHHDVLHFHRAVLLGIHVLPGRRLG